MGILIACNCKQCNHSWERYQGEGMIATFYHCNKCGNEISIQHGIDKIPICKCGGSYNSKDHPIICPECKSKKIDSFPAGCWD